MSGSTKKITFSARRFKVSAEWNVIATYPSGHKEHITGFKNEEDAQRWLGSERCQNWLRARGYEA
jgi:hypothetical protein